MFVKQDGMVTNNKQVNKKNKKKIQQNKKTKKT